MASGTPAKQPTNTMLDLLAAIDRRRDEAIREAGLGADFLAAYQAIEMQMGEEFRGGTSKPTASPSGASPGSG
jgi:hypothetical protein